jgi:hypothetical protein
VVAIGAVSWRAPLGPLLKGRADYFGPTIACDGKSTFDVLEGRSFSGETLMAKKTNKRNVRREYTKNDVKELRAPRYRSDWNGFGQVASLAAKLRSSVALRD